MMHYTDDPIRDAENYQADQEEWLKSRPICDVCGEPVQEDHYFSDGVIDVCCPNCWGQYCIDNFLIDIEED